VSFVRFRAANTGAKSFHALSEAYGFIMSLRYTNNPTTNSPYFSKSEVDAMLANMISGTNGLWDIDTLEGKTRCYIASNCNKIWIPGYTSCYSKLI
jgi:hypothetical protein